MSSEKRDISVTIRVNDYTVSGVWQATQVANRTRELSGEQRESREVILQTAQELFQEALRSFSEHLG